MKIGGLDHLKEIAKLKRIRDETSGQLDINSLERDFLKFSAKTDHTLEVKIPEFYSLKGLQEERHLSALKKLGITPGEKISEIGISGDFDGNLTDGVVIVSADQVVADHISNITSYLNPQLEKIFTSGLKVVRSFSIHEALYGQVTAYRNDLELSEAHLFPKRFKTGPYILRTELDTPNQSISKFIQLDSMLGLMQKKPQEELLNFDNIQSITNNAKELRKILGPLARYEIPNNKKFESETNYVYLNEDKTELFYLYNEKTKENVVVFFGEEIFDHKNMPKNLTIINGQDHQLALRELLERGFFEPSKNVLEKKILDLEEMFDKEIRQSNSIDSTKSEKITDLVNELKSVNKYFEGVLNPEMRIEYATKKPAEILEFMLRPKDNAPLLYSLMPRLSWNAAIREYHNTTKFVEDFKTKSDDEKKNTIRQIASSAIFRNQQNNEVNLYIARKYSNLCKDAGVIVREYNK